MGVGADEEVESCEEGLRRGSGQPDCGSRVCEAPVMEVGAEDGYGVVVVPSCFETLESLHAIVEGRREAVDLEVWRGV